MRATVGDELVVHGRIVGQHDRIAQIVEVLGVDGGPPYRVRFEDGHETLMSPGPDTVVRRQGPDTVVRRQGPGS
ncbi:DUF1918 domain-containing protein [Streptomyces sp. NPDC059002]|uniref:DUF1918 domain-containing protein n=1 Tax=Streptomyces sp. NPDC059002 TaxID=3346690 RepID=UPI00369F2F5D